MKANLRLARDYWHATRQEKNPMTRDQQAIFANDSDFSIADVYDANTFEETLHIIALQSRLLIGAHQSVIAYVPDGSFEKAVFTHSFSEKFKKYNSYDVTPRGKKCWGLIINKPDPVRMTQDELLSHPCWKNFSNPKNARGLEHPPMDGLLAVPIVRPIGGIVGILQLSDKIVGEFTQQDEDSLASLAGIIAHAFELEYVNQDLQLKNIYLEAVMHNSKGGLIITDDNGKPLLFNSTAETLFGLSVQDIVPEKWQDTYCILNSDKTTSLALEDLTCMPPIQDASTKQTVFIRNPQNSDGKYLDISTTSLIDHKGNNCGGITACQDIREHQQLETQFREQIIHNDKMASVGKLAAGVAHEINNPIGYVNSNMNSLRRYITQICSLLDVYENLEAETPISSPLLTELHLLKDELDTNFLKEDVNSLLDESLEGLSRVKKIVQDLKVFSHDVAPDWQWGDLHKSLDSTLLIVRNELKDKTEVQKNYGDLPRICCIPDQINQVILNLLVNAAHAIEGQGKVIITTRLFNAKSIYLEISDSGKGIEEKDLTRIFDPFFSTKPVGQGTGLGLSLSYGIIKTHNGTIDVDSISGKGTNFKITLPICQEGVDINSAKSCG